MLRSNDNHKRIFAGMPQAMAGKWTPMFDYATFRGRGAVFSRPQEAEVENGRPRILIVEDEAIAQLAAASLVKAGCDYEIAHTADAALAALEQRRLDVMLCAVHPNGADGIELLRKARARRPDVPVVMLTGDPSVSSAVMAMRLGAFDYVVKPFDEAELATIIGRALEMTSLRRENRRLRQQLSVASFAAGFVAESLASRQLDQTAFLYRWE